MAGLDSATGGRARLGNTEITELPDADLSIRGRCRVGFVIQSSTPHAHAGRAAQHPAGVRTLDGRRSTHTNSAVVGSSRSHPADRPPPDDRVECSRPAARGLLGARCSVPRSCSDPTCDPRGGPLTRGEGVVGFQSQPPTSSSRNSLRALTGRQSGTFPGPIALS